MKKSKPILDNEKAHADRIPIIGYLQSSIPADQFLICTHNESGKILTNRAEVQPRNSTLHRYSNVLDPMSIGHSILFHYIPKDTWMNAEIRVVTTLEGKLKSSACYWKAPTNDLKYAETDWFSHLRRTINPIFLIAGFRSNGEVLVTPLSFQQDPLRLLRYENWIQGGRGNRNRYTNMIITSSMRHMTGWGREELLDWLLKEVELRK
jgi:hypothetical protein